MLKYVHYLRDNYFENIPVQEASINLLKVFLEDEKFFEEVDLLGVKELLNLYRKIDLKQVKTIKNSSFEY